MLLVQVDHQTVPVLVRLSGNHQEKIRFPAIDSPYIPLVLGYPWLKLHNPQINLSNNIVFWSLFCHINCPYSALRPVSESLAIPEPPDLTSVPEAYHNLGLVFSKQQLLSLPPHQPYDCVIDLLPGDPLPSSHLYNLSVPEQQAMETYIQDSLAAGII